MPEASQPQPETEVTSCRLYKLEMLAGKAVADDIVLTLNGSFSAAGKGYLSSASLHTMESFSLVSQSVPARFKQH